MSRKIGPKRNLVVLAVIMNENGQFLLTRRDQPDRKHAHGKWHFVGGGIEHGEDPRETLLREIREEVGELKVHVLSEDPILYSNFFEEHDIHAILLAFPVRYISGTIDISADTESDAAQWFTVEELKSMECLPGTTELVEKAVRYIEK